MNTIGDLVGVMGYGEVIAIERNMFNGLVMYKIDYGQGSYSHVTADKLVDAPVPDKE